MESPGEFGALVRDIPRLLRKLAHNKYREEFYTHLKAVRSLGAHDSDRYSLISGDLERIEELAKVRFAG